MSGKHLCQSRLSAAYISSNRYMHIILFYFILFSFIHSIFPRATLHRPSSVLHPSFFVLHPDLLRSSFVLPSSFIRPCSSIPSSFFALHPAFLLTFHCSLSCLSNWPLPVFFNIHPLRHSLCSLPIISTALSPSFPARPGIPVLSTVLPLVFPTGLSPSFPMFTLSTISFAPPVIPALVSVIPGSHPRHSRLDRESPCHPEPVLLVILSASEGSSPTDFSIIISKHTKI